MARKHIFIGLGGSGCQTVSQLKKKIYDKLFPEVQGSKTRLSQMNENYRFLFVDTDSRDIEEANKLNRETFEHGRTQFISPLTDLVTLGNSNPQSVYYEATQEPELLLNQRIIEACSPALAARIPDQPLSFGAGAFRMKSRIAFAHSLPEFQQKLQNCITALNDVQTSGGDSNIIFYWVVGSTNGGTGSGIVNDVLYHVNMMHRQTVGGGDPQLVLTMYMPKFYIDNNNTEDKYALNAYAVFREISAFKEMSLDPEKNTIFHKMALNNDYNLYDTSRKYTPFYYLIPIDIQTDRGTSMGTSRVMYSNAAELLYNIHAGKGGDTFRSDIDNYMNDIMDRDHENFLVPMGYVALRKPNAEFLQYLSLRLKRDLLSTWLLNEDPRDTRVTPQTTDMLYRKIFRPLESEGHLRSEMEDTLGDVLSGVLNPSVLHREELPASMLWNSVSGMINSMMEDVRAIATQEAIDDTKRTVNETLWRETETMIREHGLNYAINALEALRELLSKKFIAFEREREPRKDQIDNMMRRAMECEKPAVERTIKERFISSNKEDIRAYHTALSSWANAAAELEIDTCIHNILHDFCYDEKSDLLALVQNQVSRIRLAALEMRKEAVYNYNSLGDSFSRTALDVTTVYLPSLKDISSGSGWVAGNIFSKLYTQIISAHEDASETAYRNDGIHSLAAFVDNAIYLTESEAVQEELRSKEYFVTTKEKDAAGNIVEKSDYRIFANPLLDDRKAERIIEDFILMLQNLFEQAARNNKTIQEKWYNKRISAFYYDLSIAEQDEVRSSLNPALFFPYNKARIENVKKEEHIVFVANNEEMAHNILGFQRGNPKHRFETHEDINSALVIKSKYGLSLQDYRIYDNLRLIYEKSDFLEKYHFHKDFINLEK